MDSPAPTPTIKPLTKPDRFRKNVGLTFLLALIFTFFWVNIEPTLFPNYNQINFILISSAIYAALYTFVFVRFLNRKVVTLLGTTSFALIFCTLIYITGGNNSLFIGYFSVFAIMIGLSLGLIPLIIIGLIIEILIVLLFLAPHFGTTSQQTYIPLLGNTFLNIVSFIVAYLILRESTVDSEKIGKIEELSKRQESLDEEKDVLVSIVSQEVRGPVSAIKGYIDLLEEQVSEKMTDDQKDVLKKIESNILKIRSISENTLQASVIDSGALNLFLQPVDLEKLVIESIRESLKFEAESKGLYLKTNLPETRLPLISADPQMLKQVVTNLIDNAIKYTSQGGITVSLASKDNQVVLTVTDTGCGITQDDIAKIFQKFFRVGTEENQALPGSGLGLYIAKKLVEKHSGTIDVSSEADKGTTFTVKLPVPTEDETWSLS